MMKKNGFSRCAEMYIGRLRKEGRYSTAHVYENALLSFRGFCGTPTVSFGQVTREHLRCYGQYLYERGLKLNTVSTYMRRIRCVYNQAVESGEADYIPALFKKVFTGVESKRKKALSQEEMYRLMTVRVDDPKLYQAQLALCLMFLYGGMASVDLAHLRASNFKEGILDYKRQKTGTQMRIEVPCAAIPMSKSLASIALSSSAYLYPFIDSMKTGEEGYKAYNAALASFNRNLKLLAEVAGVISIVTSYTVRHSFATTLKELDVSIEMISELLGHKSIKTTQIYLKSFSLEKMSAVNKICFESVYNHVPKVG